MWNDPSQPASQPASPPARQPARGDRTIEIGAVLIECGKGRDGFQHFEQIFDQNRE